MYAVYSTVDSASTDGSDLSPKVQGVQLQRSRPSLPLTTNCLLPSDGLIITAVAQCGLMLHLVRSSQCSRVVVGALPKQDKFSFFYWSPSNTLYNCSVLLPRRWQIGSIDGKLLVCHFSEMFCAASLQCCQTARQIKQFFFAPLALFTSYLPIMLMTPINLNFINSRVPACLRVESATINLH